MLNRTRPNSWVVLALALLLLAGCGRALRWTPDYHVVRPGETLYAIAMRYDLDHRRLAAWNGLGDGSFIRAGQRLRLQPGGPAAKPAAPVPPAPTLPAPSWRWPADGPVVLGYGASPRTQSGIRIGGEEGNPVRAVAAGEVVYAGDGLASYGQLLIVKHNATWLSAYGFNSTLLVGEGTRVSAGQTIARMGRVPSGEPRLHFEIRRNGQPVDPLRYLPQRR